MATESGATEARELNIYRNVMDNETADALFQAMAILELGIAATDCQPLDRTYLAWPNNARAVWELLDKIMIRAGVSDGKNKPGSEAAN